MKTGEARQTVSDEQQANFGQYIKELNSVSDMFLLSSIN